MLAGDRIGRGDARGAAIRRKPSFSGISRATLLSQRARGATIGLGFALLFGPAMEHTMQTARDVMQTQLLTVTPTTSLTRLARLCAEDGISGCPVVTVDGRLVGVVSKTDLLERLLQGPQDSAANLDPLELLGLGEEGVPLTADVDSSEAYGQVDDIMEREIQTVSPADPVADVARLMVNEKIHRVLVVEKGRLVGLISSLDLLSIFDD
jgi:CBS domain-containing protein